MNETTTKPLKVVSLSSLIGEGWSKWSILAWPKGFILLSLGFVLPHIIFTYATKNIAFLSVDDIRNWMRGTEGSHDPFVLAQIAFGFSGNWLLLLGALVVLIYWSLLGYQKLLASPKLSIFKAYKLALRPSIIRDLLVILVFAFFALLGSWMIIPMLIFVSSALLVPVIAASRPKLSLKNMFSYCLGLRFRNRELSYLGVLFSLLSLTCCFYLAQTLIDGASIHAMYSLGLARSVQDCGGQLLTWCAWDVNLVYFASIYAGYFILLILQGSLRFFYFSSK